MLDGCMVVEWLRLRVLGEVAEDEQWLRMAAALGQGRGLAAGRLVLALEARLRALGMLAGWWWS